MDRMVIQHTTHTQARSVGAVSTPGTSSITSAAAAASNNSNSSNNNNNNVGDAFGEISDFVQQLYKELVAQSKPHAFNDFSCIFCDAAYFELNHLIEHLEQVHRHQVQNGTFHLQPNFEEIIRNRILNGGAPHSQSGHYQNQLQLQQPAQQQQPQATVQQNVKMDGIPDAGTGQLYQCAKCFETFNNMNAVSQHLTQCAMSFGGYQQQQQPEPQQQLQQQHLGQVHHQQPQQAHVRAAKALPPVCAPTNNFLQQHQQQQHHQTPSHYQSPSQPLQQPQQHHVQQHHAQQQQQQQHQQQQQQQHHHHQQQTQQHQQQQQQQLSVPVIETPTTVPIRHEIYGCARCGLRFRVVRELVMHLHMCINDTFHDKDQFLKPELWLQAPEGQHIVINEPESNTTLNTTGLWLMSNDVLSSPDIVSKGFWVMPPNHNGHDAAAEPQQQQQQQPAPPQQQQQQHQQHQVKVEPGTAAVQQRAPVQQAAIVDQMVMPTFDQYQQPAAQQPAPLQQTVVADTGGSRRAAAARKPKAQTTVADENKRKPRVRGGRAQAAQNATAMASSSVVVDQQLHDAGATTSAAASVVVNAVQQLGANKFGFQNGAQAAAVAAQSIQAPNNKRKRYEPANTQVPTDYGHSQLINLDDPTATNYLLADYEQQQPAAVPVAIVQQQQHTQHIVTKDGLVYEQLDYSYPNNAASTSGAGTSVIASGGGANNIVPDIPIKIENQSYGIDPQQQQQHQPAAAPQQHFKKKIQARSTPNAPGTGAAAATGDPQLIGENHHAYKPPAAQPPDQILQSPPPPTTPARQTTTRAPRGSRGDRNSGKYTVADPLPQPDPPNEQLLAIIANPEDLEDLSHLDRPINIPAKVTAGMQSKQSDYIGSYCSFLASRTHTK